MIYSFFYKILPSKKNVSDDTIYLLNDQEIRYIKKCEKLSMIISAFIGGIMVVFLYLPQNIWPDLFPKSPFMIPLLNSEMSISISMIYYGIALVFVELFLLMLLNIYCSHEIGICTGYINNINKLEKEKRSFLINISKQHKSKEILELGINPYLGLNKTSIFFMNLLFTLKAAMSNFIFRLIFQKLLGRYAFRIVLDFLGIPIYAFWNAWGTRKILKESRIIIIGVNYLEYFKNEINKFRVLNKKEMTTLYDTLQYIAISKRDYHKNHYVLSKIILDTFKIEIEKEHPISKNYFNNLKTAEVDFKLLNEKIIILGLVLDGKISIREKIRINKLHSSNIISKNIDELIKISTAFNYGKGVAY